MVMIEPKDEQIPLDEKALMMRKYEELRGRASVVDVNAAAGKFVALAASMYLIVNGSPDFVKEKLPEIHQIITFSAVGLLGIFYIGSHYLQTLADKMVNDYRSAILGHEIKEKIEGLEQRITSSKEPKTDSTKTGE